MLAIAANIAVVLVAALHLWFLVLEMFLWDKPLGRRTFGMTPEKAARDQAARHEPRAVQRLPCRRLALGAHRRRSGPGLLPGVRHRGRRVRRRDGEPENPLGPGAARPGRADPGAI